ncbi:MAG: hypothetical protein O2955_21615 [Planctomycetota bacterium]|nr:hypothetical protein [Planctomycetota bacterium]MDA1215105.1 hypothetical protein [Planctomycetota bacterium]
MTTAAGTTWKIGSIPLIPTALPSQMGQSLQRFPVEKLDMPIEIAAEQGREFRGMDD